MTRILIVEDDTNIARLLQTTLAMAGYESDCCGDGASAIEKVFAQPFDLVLLDVMLPQADGFTVMEKIRSQDVPVIFLTAMQDTMDKVRGLRLGAEDYIVKPFEAMELLARIEVVLRRTHRGRSRLEYGDIVVSLDQHTVEKAGQSVSLTPKEFDVLVFFMQNLDIAITRERLLAVVWGYEFEGETRTVDIHVQTVRRKLGLQKRLITIPKLGYRLERLS